MRAARALNVIPSAPRAQAYEVWKLSVREASGSYLLSPAPFPFLFPSLSRNLSSTVPPPGKHTHTHLHTIHRGLIVLSTASLQHRWTGLVPPPEKHTHTYTRHTRAYTQPRVLIGRSTAILETTLVRDGVRQINKGFHELLQATLFLKHRMLGCPKSLIKCLKPCNGSPGGTRGWGCGLRVCGGHQQHTQNYVWSQSPVDPNPIRTSWVMVACNFPADTGDAPNSRFPCRTPSTWPHPPPTLCSLVFGCWQCPGGTRALVQASMTTAFCANSACPTSLHATLFCAEPVNVNR